MSPVPRRRSGGFTLVELLVVIAIIGVLVALLLPAVQAARESARRTQCVNNLKQLALGLHNHHDANRFFTPTLLGSTGEATWCHFILPYIEQQALYDQWHLDWRQAYYRHPASVRQAQIKGFLCPTRRSPPQLSQNVERFGGGGPGSVSDYAGNAGNSTVEWVNPSSDAGVFVKARTTYGSNDDITSFVASVRFASISDGLSNTFMLGEKHVRIKMFGGTDDHAMFRGEGPGDTARVAGRQDLGGGVFIDRPLAGSPTYAFRPGEIFGSYHPGVCQFAMCDGSVRMVRINLDLDTLNRLVLRGDGQTIGEF